MTYISIHRNRIVLGLTVSLVAIPMVLLLVSHGCQQAVTAIFARTFAGPKAFLDGTDRLGSAALLADGADLLPSITTTTATSTSCCPAAPVQPIRCFEMMGRRVLSTWPQRPASHSSRTTARPVP